MTEIFINVGPVGSLPNASKTCPEVIKEFAIQPEIMATWTHFHSYFEDFGVGHGRLICLYPVTWKTKVHELAAALNRDIHAHSIRCKISAAKHKFILPVRHDYDARRGDWQSNAEMSNVPFDAIIAKENPRKKVNVLVAGEFDKSQPPYSTKTQQDVQRTPVEMAKVASPLLSLCEELRIIDPFFDPSGGWGETFKQMIFSCPNNGATLKVCEIHTRLRDGMNFSAVESHYQRHLSGDLPAGLTVRIAHWDEALTIGKLHPRYLITDLGGIKFDYGFDGDKDRLEHNEAILLHHERTLELIARYTTPHPSCSVFTIQKGRQ
jgi:hypothetical protein